MICLSDMIYDLSNELQKKQFKTRANALYKRGVIVELTEKKAVRTLQQNKYLHLILGYFCTQTGYQLEYVKQVLFKRTVNADLFVSMFHDNLTGKDEEILKSTSSLSKTDMTTAIDRFRNWSADVAGVYLPEAGEEEFIEQIQIELDRNKSYLYESK